MDPLVKSYVFKITFPKDGHIG